MLDVLNAVYSNPRNCCESAKGFESCMQYIVTLVIAVNRQKALNHVQIVTLHLMVWVVNVISFAMLVAQR